MKSYTKIIFGMTLFALALTAEAQTPFEQQKIMAKNDLESLHKLKIKAEDEYQKNREKALKLAAIYGWPESYETENGGLALLVGVLNEKDPLYLKTFNSGAAITARVDRINTGGSSGLDLNGENMIIGVWDGGRVRNTHEIFEGRASQFDGETTQSTHHTHVTGTIIGTGDVMSGQVKGMAHKATTYNYSFANDFSEMVDALSNFGIILSNHSYGFSATDVDRWRLGFYDETAQFIDNLQYTSPYYLPVWAAGNDRNANHPNQAKGGYDILTSHSVAKNNLVVAASEEVLNYTGPSSVVMSSFSSWGPTDDGRIKPDITAKGVGTLSATSVSNTSYGTSQGTSMAAPSVTGALALLQQHYNDLNGDFMLSSSLRGLVLHTTDEAGDHPGPDYRFGWGLINAERAADVISNDGTTAMIMELTLNQGNVLQFSGSAIPGEKLIATITWTDRQGSILPEFSEDDDTPRLVNDLDLRVVQDGVVHRPWVLNPFNYAAAATKGDNFRDNIEKIEIDNPSGDYVFRVTHKGNLFSGKQVVSLIISGVENLILSNTDQDFISTSVFPNPATNELNIRTLSQISNVEIMNLIGQSYGVTEVNSNNAKLDISELKPGTYFVRVTIDNASKVYKFIKK